MTASRLTLALALAALLPAGRAAAEDGAAVLAAIEDRLVAVVGQVEPSVVSVVRGNAAADRNAAAQLNGFGIAPGLPGRRFDFPGLNELEFVPEQFGAGVVLADADGNRFILTNHHVVRGGPAAGASGPAKDGDPRVYVRFHDRRGYYAEIHASDPRSDLAVLRIDYGQLGATPPQGPDDFPRPLPLARSEEYRKGQFVFVFGNPYAIARDGSASVGWGIVGNVLRRPAPAAPASATDAERNPTIHHYGSLLQLDCRLDLGFSGGPVVNRAGELIGLTTSLAALEGYESTAGFAIPIDAATRRIIDSLLKGHEAEYGFLGVAPGDVAPEQIRIFAPGLNRTDGAVKADSVKAGSPADRAGLKAGDLILAIDGRPARNTADLMRHVGLAGPGAEVTFDTLRPAGNLRGGQRRTVRVRLDKWPVADDKEIVATVPRYEPWRGLRVDYATARQRYLNAAVEPYPLGVVVLEAAEPIGGPDPLKPGDFVTAVDERPVGSPDDFYAAVRNRTAATLSLSDGRRVTVQ